MRPQSRGPEDCGTGRCKGTPQGWLGFLVVVDCVAELKKLESDDPALTKLTSSSRRGSSGRADGVGYNNSLRRGCAQTRQIVMEVEPLSVGSGGWWEEGWQAVSSGLSVDEPWL